MSGKEGWHRDLVETKCRPRYYWLGEIAASPLNGIPIQALLARSWSEHMDGLLNLTIFLAATFASALVAGLSGFAFGLIAASLWLYVISPLQTAALIIAFGLLVQGYSVWKLRHALDWRRLWPFVIGAALGVPIGVTILTWANPAHVRVGVGILLVQPVCPFPSGHKAHQGGRFFCRCDCRISKWRARGNYRPCGHSRNDMVRPAGLAERPATSSVPAGRSRNFCHERGVAWRKGRNLGGNDQAIPVRTAGLACRHLVGAEALRKSQRNDVSQNRAVAVVAFWRSADRLAALLAVVKQKEETMKWITREYVNSIASPAHG